MVSFVVRINENRRRWIHVSSWQRNELIYILATPLLCLYCGGDDTNADVCVHMCVC